MAIKILTPKIPAKSNVAKSAAIKVGRRFDKRVVGILIVLLVVLVGYLFLRFSQASTLKDYAYSFPYDTKSIDVIDPQTKALVKTISLATVPASPCKMPDGSTQAAKFSELTDAPGTDRAYAVPTGCYGGAGELTPMQIAVINTKDHSYTGTSITVNMYPGGFVHGIANIPKKHLYLLDTNNGRIAIVDMVTNKVIKYITAVSTDNGRMPVGMIASGDGSLAAILYGAKAGSMNAGTPDYYNVAVLDTTAYELVRKGKVSEEGFIKNGFGGQNNLAADGTKTIYAVAQTLNNGDSVDVQKMRIAKIDLSTLTASYSPELSTVGACQTVSDMEMTARGLYFISYFSPSCQPLAGQTQTKIYLYNPTTFGVSAVSQADPIANYAWNLSSMGDGSGLYVSSNGYTGLRAYSFASNTYTSISDKSQSYIIRGGVIASTTTPSNITSFNLSDFSVTQTGGYAPTKTLSDGRTAVYKKISIVPSENYGLVFSDKTTKAAGRYCYEYQISKTMNIAVNYAVVETVPSPKQISSSVLNVSFPATAAGTYGTACTANVTVISATNQPYRSVTLGDSNPVTAGELWVTKAWFEEVAIAPGTATPVANTPVVTTSPTTSTSTSTDPVPQNATKVKQ